MERSFFVLRPYFFPRVTAVPQDPKLDEHIVFHLLTVHNEQKNWDELWRADGSKSEQCRDASDPS